VTRRTTIIAWVLIGLVAAPALVLTLLRWSSPDAAWAVQVVAFTPWAMAPYSLALVACGVGLLRGLPVLPAATVSAVLACGLALHLCWLAPLYTGDRPEPAAGAEPMVVMSSNVRLGLADAGAISDEVAAAGVDVLVLVEVTPEFWWRFQQTSAFADLPYSAVSAGESRGTMVLSRTPVRTVARPETYFGSVVVDIDGRRILAAHPVSPTEGRTEWWHQDHRLVLRAAREHHVDLIVGDLNATGDHEPMRRLAGAGWRDAAELLNRGFRPTWPAHHEYFWFPRPVVPIDHLLAADTTAVLDLDAVDIAGTDHLALVITVAEAA